MLLLRAGEISHHTSDDTRMQQKIKLACVQVSLKLKKNAAGPERTTGLVLTRLQITFPT